MDALLMQRSNHAEVVLANRDINELLTTSKRNVLCAIMAAIAVISFAASPLLAEEHGTLAPGTIDKSVKAAKLRYEAAKLAAQAKAIMRAKKKNWNKQASEKMNQARALLRQANELDSAEEKSGGASVKSERASADQSDVVPIREVLNQMPQDLRPTSSRWDKLKLPKAAEWFKQNVHGRTIRLQAFVGSVSTSYLGKDKYEIRVKYMLRRQSFVFNGLSMHFIPSFESTRFSTLFDPGLGSTSEYWFVKFSGDEELARRYSNTQKGASVVIQGTVSSAFLSHWRRETEAACGVTIADITGPVKEKPGLEGALRESETAGVASISNVLNRMPKNLLPDPEKGWDKLTLPKVNEWLAGYVPKKPFRGQLAFAGCSIRHVRGNQYCARVVWNKIPDAKLTFRKQILLLRLVRIHSSLNDRYGKDELSKTYSVGQAQAEKWQKEPKGKRFDIGGQIVSAALFPSYNEGVYFCSIRVLVNTISEHKAGRTVTKKPKPTTKPARSKAASRIRLAKAYLSSGLKAKAVSILKEVIKKYPNTKAAEEAKELLKDTEK